MAIKINFDTANRPEEPTFVLAKKNGDKLGVINAKSIQVTGNLNDASEITFNVYKYVDDEIDYLWDKIVNFKLVYCVEWNQWFEITVELDESNETKKTVFGKSLGHAELGQIMLYNVEINTDADIGREDYDENMPTVLYRDGHPEASLLHRLLNKAPHYSIGDVDDTIASIQKTFSFSDISIYDAFQEIAEEIGCLFVFDCYTDSNGKLCRTISVHDLESNCGSCHYRGEFSDNCPECGSTDINEGYGEDTGIFVASDELADNIQLTYDTDAMKNCFKLEAGDDLMTATIKNCNPNGSDYIWYLSDNMRSDMSDGLVAKIDEYNALYKSYQTNNIMLDESYIIKYNEIVDKYDSLNKDLKLISTPIKGFSSLIDAYYNTFDLYLYLQSSLMPTVNTSAPSIDDEVKKLTAANISPVAVNLSSNSTINPLESASVPTADNIVLSMAKTLIDSRYKIKVADGSTLSAYTTGATKRTWQGRFIVSSYSDDDVTRTTNTISVEINNDYETFVKRKLDKALSNVDDEDVSISGLFNKDIDGFKNALKQYSLNRLLSFQDACQSCIEVMVENGVADGETWGNTTNEDANLYKKLYEPYLEKLDAIIAEIAIRESEIETIVGVRDEDGDLKTYGLQNIIEDKKNEIQNALNFEKFLGESLWLEFCSFRREDKYSNSNYVSDGLNNAELISKASEFIDVAQKEIYKSAELQCSISATLKNLLVIKKFAPLVDSFKTGNWLRAMADDEVYKLRMISYSIDYDSLDNISVEFSDTVKAKSTIKSVQDVIQQASSMATSYSAVQRQAKQGEQSNSVINNWFSDGLDTTNTKIISGAGGQSQSWDNHGMLFREYNSATNDYNPEQMKIINSTLAVTNDNWKTTKAAVGKYYYFENDVMKMAYGVNAETIVGKLLLGEQLRIGNKTGTMSFDENGFAVDCGYGNAMTFNENGLILKHDNDNAMTFDKNGIAVDCGNGNSMTFNNNGISVKNNDSNTMTFDENGLAVNYSNSNTMTFSSNGLVAKNSNNTVSINPNNASILNVKSGSKDVLSFDGEGNLAIVGNITASSLDLNDNIKISADNLALATIAATGEYDDLLGGTAADEGKALVINNEGKVIASDVSYSHVTDAPTLAAVATSGKYTDLSGNASDSGKVLSVSSSGGITTTALKDVATTGKYTDLTGATTEAGKLLYVDTDGSVTTISIADLKIKLGI